MTLAGRATKVSEDHAARIGPNAVIRLLEALRAMEPPRVADRIFRSCDVGEYLVCPPSGMVDEREVTALYRALHLELGDDRARTIGRVAGQRTADYLLRYRIPRAAALAMRWMPSRGGAHVLAAAIARHGWTFAGSGLLSVRHGRPVEFSIRGCPLCRGATSKLPYCDFYAATFERLFADLIHPGARAAETACQAAGAAACTFSIGW